jgi:hypothetical protein
MDPYKQLQSRIREFESIPGMSLARMVDELRGVSDIDWPAMEAIEHSKPTWNPSKWHWYVIRQRTTPGRFPCGGDRVSGDHSAACYL